MASCQSWLAKICFVCLCLAASFSCIIDAKNTLYPHQVLNNGHTLVSNNHRFEVGFFDVSSNKAAGKDSDQGLWYLGAWYKGVKPLTVVWVCNRHRPLSGVGIKLVFNSNGDLSLHEKDTNVHTIFCPSQQGTVTEPLLVLMDSGNLVIEDGGDKGGYAWQSFNSPSDTLLPGMKIGWDFQQGLNRLLTSWRTPQDPSPGEFALGVDSPCSPQIVLKRDQMVRSRWDPWDWRRIGSTYASRGNPTFDTPHLCTYKGIYLTLEALDESVLLRMVVTSLGLIHFLKWNAASNAWEIALTLNDGACDRYASCGPYGICCTHGRGSNNCHCPEGFVGNSTHRRHHRPHPFKGCVRKNTLNCTSGDGFVKLEGLILPDNRTTWPGLNASECENQCRRHCSCTAYTSLDVYGNGSECVVWMNDLVDIRDSPRGGGEELYIRVARDDLGPSPHSRKKRNVKLLISVLTAASLATLFCCAFAVKCFIRKSKNEGSESRNSILGEGEVECVQSFSLSTIYAATDDFALANKIGQGGFGPVYKGTLEDGQRIAVKRLSEQSRQGLQEFNNEVKMIAQLQHRHLVKLIGFCIQGEERMLIYEFLQNKSLDRFIFDNASKRTLVWAKRFTILKGIAKGLDYLHSGSRLRIIHRDLKASNILLDEDMNPKISDFGLARASENDREEITRRITGTYGYMAPEYAMFGHYSAKSDVFSYGVLVLETISGERNWGFKHPDHDFNLLGHAWKLWHEGRDMEMMDRVLLAEEEAASPHQRMENEVRRCLQIGLLCVQHSTDERPMMSQVVSMLENEDLRMFEPHEPGFFSHRSGIGPRVNNNNNNGDVSVNLLTFTTLTARS